MKNVWGTSLLHQVVLISSMKPIASSISLRMMGKNVVNIFFIYVLQPALLKNLYKQQDDDIDEIPPDFVDPEDELAQQVNLII